MYNMLFDGTKIPRYTITNSMNVTITYYIRVHVFENLSINRLHKYYP